MPDFLDFLPLIERRIDDIRAQLDADANAGLTPDDARWQDTTVGGAFFDLTQTCALEIERLWDFLGTEVPAAALLPYAFGDYLDDHGEALDVPRKDEVRATGTIRFTGLVGSQIATGTQVAVPAPDPDSDPMVFQTTASGTIAGTAGTTATLDLAAEAVEAGTAGNVALNAITLLLSPVGGVSAVTNPLPMTGGADVESDEAYRTRLLLEFQGAVGSGTVADYQRWGLAYPGVGYVTVEPIWNGPGSVRLIVTSPDNDPVAGAVVTGLQDRLDPVPGQGRGQAPIGHTVTVASPTALVVNVAGTVVHSAGYSLDGTGGTIATRAGIVAALSAYIDRLAPGDDVVLNRTEAQFFEVEGVYNVSGVTLNGTAADVAVGSLQVATLGTVTLS